MYNGAVRPGHRTYRKEPKMTPLRCSASLFIALTLSVWAVAQPVSTVALIQEMIDLRRLAEYPDPSYRMLQFSSYDRTSSIPEGPGWFANSDGFGGEPQPNVAEVLEGPDETGFGRFLICDVEGPGALVRTWTARMNGDFTVYLDGSPTPIYRGPAERFLRFPYESFARQAAVPDNILNGTFYQRNAAYCPMPFERRLRIEWNGNINDTHFYHVQVRQYEAGTTAFTFEGADLDREVTDLADTHYVLSDPNTEWDVTSYEKPRGFRVEVPPYNEFEAVALEGMGAVERLVINVEAADMAAALRGVILRITFDGAAMPQVEVPIGDFFGSAPGINPGDSAPVSVSPDGTLVSRWVMPYRESCRIHMRNLTTADVTVSGEVLPSDYQWGPNTMHFRARWRIDHNVTGDPQSPVDMPFLIARGQGVYVGSVLSILNPNEVPTVGGSWWGEGDEKIFVDGSPLPTLFGTGSEDYFNYAWSAPAIFMLPYCGQPRSDGPANRGFVSNYRWHILDPIPFERDIAFYMELLPHERTDQIAYARTAYYYAKPGTVDDHAVITSEHARKQTLPGSWRPKAREGAAGSLYYEPEEVLLESGAEDGPVTVEESGGLYSAGQLMRWLPQEEGEEIRFRIPVPRAGEYTVRAVLSLDPQGSMLELNLGSQSNKGGTLNLYEGHRTMLRAFGTNVMFPEGDVDLIMTYRGPVPEAEGSTVGIDFLWIQPVQE